LLIIFGTAASIGNTFIAIAFAVATIRTGICCCPLIFDAIRSTGLHSIAQTSLAIGLTGAAHTVVYTAVASEVTRVYAPCTVGSTGIDRAIVAHGVIELVIFAQIGIELAMTIGICATHVAAIAILTLHQIGPLVAY
jgi:hypothetical protein